LVQSTDYRSPLTDDKSNEDFVNSFNPLLKIIEKSKTHTIILGDLNYNLLEFQNPHINNFVDLMFEYKLYPTINITTRITIGSATLIDHIWTNIYI